MTLVSFDVDIRKPIYARSGALIQQTDFQDLLHARIAQTVEDVQRRTDIVLKDLSRNGKRISVVRSCSSYLYNCVGMIFASRRAWIEINEIYHIFREDGFCKISFDKLSVGDIVVYTSDMAPAHVGLVTTVRRTDGNYGKISSVEVLSKWGRDAEILHPMHSVPSTLGTASEFWSEKVSGGFA